MPRLYGINLVGVLLATLAFYFVGFIFYGVLFNREWMIEIIIASGTVAPADAVQMTAERLNNAFAEAFPHLSPGLSMGFGFINALVTASFLAVILRHLTASDPGLVSFLGWGAAIATGFALTTLAYDVIYAGVSMKLFLIDTGHLFCAYLAASAVLSRFE